MLDLDKVLQTQLSLEDAANDPRTKFEMALMLFNSFLSFPKKTVETNPAALKKTISFYNKIFKSVLPLLDDTGIIIAEDFDQNYFNTLCLPIAKGIYDCVKFLDYKTRFSRSDLANVQQIIYNIYEEYIKHSKDAISEYVLQLLSSAILEIDKIFEYGKIERYETLTQPTDLYVFVSRIYPSVTPEEFEDNLDRFVQENNLKCDKLFLLPKGHTVKYYV
jgi:ribosomal protein S15P/S13E